MNVIAFEEYIHVQKGTADYYCILTIFLLFNTIAYSLGNNENLTLKKILELIS